MRRLRLLVVTSLVLGLLLLVFPAASEACSGCGCSGGAVVEKDVFHEISERATIAHGTKEISYDDFMMLRNSGEEYVLLDVLPTDVYTSGHIEGAASFPVTEINQESAQARLSPDAHIVVYCGSFKCQASVMAAQKLAELGYNVVDYKGGLAEWQEKGNELVAG